MVTPRLTPGAKPLSRKKSRGRGVVEESEAQIGEAPSAIDAEKAMHLHRPKPLHGAREILTEVGVIVIGIAIALLGEQAVEALRWRGEVAETRRRLSVELGTLMGQAEFRARASVCVQRRLDELAAVVDDAARSGRLPALGEPSFPSLFIWGTGAWQSAVSAQALTHLNHGELKGYSDAYKFIGQVDEANRSEGKVWTTLYGLAGPGRPFDAAEATAAREAIGEARYLGLLHRRHGRAGAPVPGCLRHRI